MPRDKRLWMTFPIDFWQHPKVAPLPVAAKWAFVEMNGYSRLHDLDGRIPGNVARYMWSAEVLEALNKSDILKPIACWDEHVDDWVLTDYAEHQETREQREARFDRNRANGSKGGRPKSPPETQSVTESVTRSVSETEPRPNPAPNPDLTHAKPESESESESEIDQTTTNTQSVSPVSDRARNAGLTDRGIRSIISTVSLHCDIDATEAEAVELAEYVASKAKTAVKSPAAYVRNAIETGPSEIDAWFRARQRRTA